MFCKRRPPPLPLSAALPIIKLALITRPGPVPSLGPQCQGATRNLVDRRAWRITIGRAHDKESAAVGRGSSGWVL